MKKFLFKISIFICFFLCCILALIWIDPYKIIWHYDTEEYNNFIVPFNKDVVSTRLLIENSKTVNYNSFIVGSSISQAFETSYWKKQLTNSDTIFHLSAYDENLIGVYGKLKLADDLGLKIENVLWVLDAGGFAVSNIDSNIARKHYLHTGNPAQFYTDYLKSFTKIKFFTAVIDYSIFNTYRNYYMGVYILKPLPPRNLMTNDQDYQHEESLIKQDSVAFYTAKRLQRFENRKPKTPQQQNFINNNKKRELFNKVQQLLKQNGTSVKIIIPPSYEEFWLSDSDIAFLNSLFGKEYIFNFSGRNKFTKEIGNFLDESHFRTPIAEKIMDSIYKK